MKHNHPSMRAAMAATCAMLCVLIGWAPSHAAADFQHNDVTRSVVRGSGGSTASGMAGGTGATGIGGPNGLGGEELSVADEAIGTLPSYWAPDDATLYASGLGATFAQLELRLSFDSYVPESLVQSVFTEADGAGIAVLSPGGLDAFGSQLIRVRVVGDVSLSLNVHSLQQGHVSTVTRIGGLFVGGIGQISAAGIATSPFALDSLGGGLDLNLSGGNGLAQIEDGPFELLATSIWQHQSSVRLSLNGGQVEYLQTLVD